VTASAAANAVHRAGFAADYRVSAATLARLDEYVALLADWQERINLIASSTLVDVWQRHIADSAQVAALVDATDTTVWLDIGSGAGFPALVLAALCPGTFHLVEATAKKCAFLAAAASVLGVADRVVIHNRRIEAMRPFAADIITARACASLTQLYAWGAPFSGRAQWVLMKGRTVADEVAAAASEFICDHHLVASRTDDEARIVVAHNVRRRR
jgi:16S rRNA (guanine527-N7)-methyltransferase